MAKQKSTAQITFEANTKQFDAAIKDSNKTLGDLKSELKLNSEEMKTTGTNVQNLTERQKLLQSQLNATRDKTAAMERVLEEARACFGDNATVVTKYQRTLNYLKAEEKKAEQALNKCNAELEKQEAAEIEAATATAKLTDKIDEQQGEVARLKKEYVDAVLQYGETSDEAKKLAREIEDLSGELKQSKSDFSAATQKAEALDRSLDDAGDAARNSEDGFTVAKGAIADLASSAIQAAIGKVSEFVGWLKELPEATREIRQDFATLETSFEGANLTTEQAQTTWKELYKIFGEDDRAVEASNLIAKFADNQNDLCRWVTITKGVYGSYQDSLPVEALAEATNETA